MRNSGNTQYQNNQQQPEYKYVPPHQDQPQHHPYHRGIQQESQAHKNPQQVGGFEIIRQGLGITQPIRADIVEYFRHSHAQTEYKNPADYIKHRLDTKYGPFWFVFMWEDKQNQSAQCSYYNNDDQVIEFKALGWQVLIYSFHQQIEQDPMIPQTNLTNTQNHPIDVISQPPQNDINYPTDDPYNPNYYGAHQVPDYYRSQHHYRQQDQFDSYYEPPRYPYPSLMYRPQTQNPRWYYY